MINVTFVGEAQRDIRKKLLKLEGFAGINASQLLKVATKVFVNRDQEAQKEVEQKIKKKVDLLAAALNRQGGHSSTQGRG
jgi:aspartate/methionine/tyrosine aminotransferase